MALCLACGGGASLTTITKNPALANLGQAQALLFQRRYSTGTTENVIDHSVTDTTLLATWTALTAASDSTKVVATPEIQNPALPNSENRTFGGGNATAGGKITILGQNASSFTCEFHGLPSAVKKQLQALACEELVVYIVNECGHIGARRSGTEDIKGIVVQVSTMGVSDRSLGGLDEPDRTILTFSLPPGWDDDFVIVQTAFDARTLS